MPSLKIKEVEKQFNRLHSRLNEIEQEVKLGTIDNVVLALMILVVGISISLIIWGFSESKQYPLYALVSLLLIMFLIPFLNIMMGYLSSIFFEQSRFKNKSNVLTILLSVLLFLTLIIGLPITLERTLPNLDQSKTLVFYIIALIVYGIPVGFGIYINPKIKRYFLENFPNLHLKRINKLNKEDRKQSLKKLKITLPKLKKLGK